MAAGKYIDILKDRGFFCFFWTQFLGAFNDNFYKIIITLVALDIPAGGGIQYIPLIGGLFIIPFLLFSGYAGYLADVYSKRTILVAVKVFEIFAMGLGLLAFFVDRMEPMLAVVFLMGLHSTFFSPAKYGILPEMLPEKDLSRGNGLLEMSTFVAIILGTSLSGPVFEAWKDNLPWIGVLLLIIAITGMATSLGIPRVSASGAAKLLRLNPFGEIYDGLRRLREERPLWLTVLGISYFWFLGALIQIDMLFFGKELLALTDAHVTLLGTFLAIGIGLGSLAAGRLSGDHIELGLVPLGSIAMGVCLGLVALSAPSYPLTAISLVLLGFSAGVFAVPLNALLQHRSGKEEKGQLIATNNFMNTIGMFLAAGIHWVLKAPLQLSPDTIISLIGLLTIGGT